MRVINSNILKGGKSVAAGAVLAGGMLANAAFAQATGDDYSGILSGLSVGTAVTAIISAGALLAAVGFARWATKKVAKFFG